MQIQETSSQGLNREFEIKIPATEIEDKLNKHLKSIGKKAKIPGFRPGKVPLNILNQRYREGALAEVLEDCIDTSVKQVLKEKNIRPALKPKINVKSYEDGKDLEFEVQLEILPTIGEIDLNNLSFERYVVTVPKEEISGVIENFAKRIRETRPIQEPRKTKKGDIVIIDFEGFVDNEPIEGGSGKGHSLELGSGSFISGFEDQLIGQDKGSHLKINVIFPKDYHESKYANKPANFDVTITDIHEADTIKIDTALAEKLGFESLETMETSVEKMIAKNYTEHSFLNTKRHVLDALAERFVFDVPQGMIELEFANIWQQLLRELGISEEKTANKNIEDKEAAKKFEEIAGKSEEELKGEYKVIAERRVRLGLLLAEIGNRNDLSVTNQELLNALMAKAKEFPGHEKEIFDFYRNNESALASLRAPIFENKVVEFILSQSKVTEKKITPEKLEKLLSVEEEEAEKRISTESEKQKKPRKKKES